MLPAVDLALTSSAMVGAGPYTTLVRSYNVLYTVRLQLDIVPADRDIVENAEDFVNFRVHYFFSASNISGSSLQFFAALGSLFQLFIVPSLLALFV